MNAILRLAGMRAALARAAGLSAVGTLGVVALAVGLATGLARLSGHAEGEPVPAFLIAGTGLLVRAAAGVVGEVVAGRDCRRVVAHLRADLVRRLIGDADAVAAAGGVGPAAVLAASRLTAAATALQAALAARAQAVAVPLVVLVALAAIDWPSAAIVAACVPLVPLFMVLVGRYTRDETLATVRALDRISTHITELVRGLPVLVGLGRAGQRLAQLRRLGSDSRQQAMRTMRSAFLSAVVLELLATMAMALVAVMAGLRLVSGSVPLATGLAALLLAPEVFNALRMLGAAYHSADDAVEAVARTQQILGRPAPVPVRSPSTEDDALRLDQLRVRYAGRTAPAVPGVTARFGPGEAVHLAGASGTGKSTVLDVIAGRLRPGASAELTGEVVGVPARVGHVPQHPRCSGDTVAEELRLHGAAENDIPGLLREVGLDSGLAPRRCAELSPGELQLMALARALVQVRDGAGLLLLDEPTAHVDPERAEKVARLLNGLRGSVTTLVASHDPALAAVADREVALR